MESKSFNKLLDFLKSKNINEVKLSLMEIENIIQDNLPPSAKKRYEWWHSTGPKDHLPAYILQSANWYARPTPSKNFNDVIFSKEITTETKVKNNKKMYIKNTKKRDDVISPTPDEVIKYLDIWNNLGSYVIQEEALDDLFLNTYPENKNIKQVIIKVSALNDFYSTNIFKVFPVAENIIDLNIDERLEKNDLKLVNDIANVKVLEQTETSAEKYINFYSFATKYCSRYKPTEYPIYDYYVEQVLKYFRNTEKRITFRNDDIKVYSKFKQILLDFREVYNLEQYNLKEIDKYLWLMGKEKFPKKYKKLN